MKRVTRNTPITFTTPFDSPLGRLAVGTAAWVQGGYGGMAHVVIDSGDYAGQEFDVPSLLLDEVSQVRSKRATPFEAVQGSLAAGILPIVEVAMDGVTSDGIQLREGQKLQVVEQQADGRLKAVLLPTAITVLLDPYDALLLRSKRAAEPQVGDTVLDGEQQGYINRYSNINGTYEVIFGTGGFGEYPNGNYFADQLVPSLLPNTWEIVRSVHFMKKKVKWGKGKKVRRQTPMQRGSHFQIGDQAYVNTVDRQEIWLLQREGQTATVTSLTAGSEYVTFQFEDGFEIDVPAQLADRNFQFVAGETRAENLDWDITSTVVFNQRYQDIPAGAVAVVDGDDVAGNTELSFVEVFPTNVDELIESEDDIPYPEWENRTITMPHFEAAAVLKLADMDDVSNWANGDILSGWKIYQPS